MAKKILIVMIFVLILSGAFGIILAVRYDSGPRQVKPDTKASEITIRLIEGWSNKEIGAYLEKESIVPSKDFLLAIKNFDTLEYRGFLPKEADGNLQGFLYPDTYRLFASVKASSTQASEQIITKLLENFGKKLPANASASAEKQGITLYEAIILASVIEKETGRSALTEAQKQGLNEERKIIAGIFYNRLKIKMALQSDATVNYVTGKNDPAVSEADSKIDSPYNTYKYPGLPPTPICNPSLSSIKAALNPAETDYLYFLHDQTSGKAYYAVTYEEHLKNKQKYLK